MRIYVPATMSILRSLLDHRQLMPRSGTAFAVTAALRESYASGNDDELAEVALAEAALASLRLLATENSEIADAANGCWRRAVIAADVEHAAPRPDLDDAVVRVTQPIELRQVASVHVDVAEAEPAIRAAAAVVDVADLGDTDASFVVGDAEDHQLAWYTAAELPFLLALM